MPITAYEVDFLPVGEETRSGDAILFRYVEDGNYKIILIDGGYQSTGKKIIEHLDKHYASRTIDHVICSHLDQDHIGGLQEVIENCSVGTFWINHPLNYTTQDMLAQETDRNRFSRADAEVADELVGVANSQHIPIDRPLYGKRIGPFSVCSPSESFFCALVTGDFIRQSYSPLDMLGETFHAFMELVISDWSEDRLFRLPETSVCNESSTVLYANPMANERVLFTADAGIEALTRTAEVLRNDYAFLPGSLSLIQIPHHGSRHNVNSAVLNSLLGSIQLSDLVSSGNIIGTAIASVAAKAMDDPKDQHPRFSVRNAFRRRGYACYTSVNGCIHHSRNLWDRGWPSSEALPFSSHEESLE